jgi:PAS domain S-box-containing protein
MAAPIPQKDYKKTFDHISAAILLIATDAPVYTILDVNEAYLAATNSTRGELIGRSVFGAFPANPTDEESKNIERTVFSFKEAIRTQKPHTMSNYRYDIPVRGTSEFEERYWTTTNTPVLDESGHVSYLIHSPANVTELNKLREREILSIAALKNQREQLYATFMQAPVGIAIFRGPEFIVDLINPPLCEIYAKTVEEMMGRPVFDVLVHIKGHGFEELLDQVRLTGIPFKGQAYPAPLIRKGQLENVYFDFVYEPFLEIDGSISGVIAVATEVTDQVTARQRIEEAEERARLAVDAVGLGTYDLDLETGEMITTDQFAHIFGFDRPVPRSAYIEVFHPDDRELREQAHIKAVTSGKLFYESRVRWPDHSLRWVRVEGKVFYDQSGTAVRILGTLLDITSQMQAREDQQRLTARVAESEQLLRSITTAAPTGLWMSDEHGDITYINQTWIDWTGITLENHLGPGWVRAIIPEDRQRASHQFFTDLAGRELFEVEFRISHADGTIHWCIATGRPQYGDDAAFTGYIGAFVDISEQKQLQRQKDDFIGIASHELKTPVTSIKAYTQVLGRMLAKNGETREADMIRRMDGQLNRLTSLIGDLLDVTKINSGKLQFNDREFDFDAQVAELVEELQHTTDKHKLVIHAKAGAMVYSDKERISQVITNLISNAIKYSPASGQIIITTKRKPGEVILCVQDFGIGIDEANLNRVFEQFYRVSGDMQHTFPGLGLGLYISSEIIRREGGRIWVTSKKGQGSTFYFALPLKSNS